MPKVQVRAKIFTKDEELTPGMTTDRYEEAKKRYQENLGKVDEFVSQKSQKLVSKQLTRKIINQGNTQAVGQMLGHKVDFENMSHATKTIM